MSFKPGVSAFGMLRSSHLRERLDITIIKADETCAALHDALLPEALILQGEWETLSKLVDFGNVDEKCLGNSDGFHIYRLHASLPIGSAAYRIHGIDFSFDEELMFPLSQQLPKKNGCIFH